MHDLAILRDNIDNIDNLQPQIEKLTKFAEWAHTDLNLAKCVITSNLNKAKSNPP